MNRFPRSRWLGAAMLIAPLLAGCRAEAPRGAPRDATTSVPGAAPTPAPVPDLASAVPAAPGAQPPADQPSAAPAAPLEGGVPLTRGLVLVSARSAPDGDRENVITVADASPDGVTYVWQYRQRDNGGQETEGTFERFVRANDLASAPRISTVYMPGRRDEAPGYTAFTISRAVYARVRAGETVPFTIATVGDASLGGLLPSRVTLKGALARVSPTVEPMPLLIDGRRVSVPTVRMRGSFAFQEQKEDMEYWVLADSTHPLILKVVSGPYIYQTVRIERPESAAAPAAIERALTDECRAELPGIYFAFASDALEEASNPALAQAAALLGRHADWSLGIEGHTDSIGDPARNRALSLRRAEAVRAALVERHGLAPQRLEATGLGDTKPREPNGTLEGRARNRRVELVRRCAGANGN